MMMLGHHFVFGSEYYYFTPEPEYQLVLDKAALLGYDLPTDKEMFYQNEMIKELKASGIWNRLDQLYNWYHSALMGFGFSSINWINPNFILTRNTGLTATFLPREGARLSGLNGTYFTGNFNPQTENGKFKLGDASFGWVNGVSDTGDGGWSGIFGTDGLNQLLFRQHVDIGRARQYFQQGGGYASGVMSALTPVSKNNVFVLSTRTVSNNKIFQDGIKYRDGAITYLGSGGTTASNNVNYTFYFGRKGNNLPQTLRMAFTGGNLTETQCIAFNTIWFNYVTNIN